MAFQTQLVPQPASTYATMRDPNKSFDTQATLLLAAIESFTVGLVIVAQNGTILHKNSCAQTLLEEMCCTSPTVIPKTLWKLCQSLIANQDIEFDLFATDAKIILEDEIATNHGTIHTRAQWFDWCHDTYQSRNCFLITLEDRQQSLTAIAKQEAQRYGLTAREADVWYLRRLEYSYKEIATTLHISENTVKKHLKNIYSKKENYDW